eukprot:365830-Chlamydomonas_euryale.AAC.2
MAKAVPNQGRSEPQARAAPAAHLVACQQHRQRRLCQLQLCDARERRVRLAARRLARHSRAAVQQRQQRSVLHDVEHLRLATRARLWGDRPKGRQAAGIPPQGVPGCGETAPKGTRL